MPDEKKQRRPTREEPEAWLLDQFGSWDQLVADRDLRAEAIKTVRFQATALRTNADMLFALLAKLEQLDADA